MYSFNRNIEDDFAANKKDAIKKSNNQIKYDKIIKECRAYVRKINPPKGTKFFLGSMRKNMFSFKKRYFFELNEYGSVNFTIAIFAEFTVSRYCHSDIEHISQIIGKKKAEEALAPLSSKIFKKAEY